MNRGPMFGFNVSAGGGGGGPLPQEVWLKGSRAEVARPKELYSATAGVIS